MTITEKLNRIRALDRDLIPEALEEVKRYYEIATMCTASNNSTGVTPQKSASVNNNREKAMLKYAMASARVDALQNELAGLKLEMLQIINKIENSKKRRFAKLYYIDQETQSQIAKKTNYAYSTVKNAMVDIKKVLKST